MPKLSKDLNEKINSAEFSLDKDLARLVREVTDFYDKSEYRLSGSISLGNVSKTILEKYISLNKIVRNACELMNRTSKRKKRLQPYVRFT